jgi:hypothetical protein
MSNTDGARRDARGMAVPGRKIPFDVMSFPPKMIT